MGVAGVPIGSDRRHVERDLAGGVGAVDQDGDPGRLRAGHDSRHREDRGRRPEGDVVDDQKPRAGGEGGGDGLDDLIIMLEHRGQFGDDELGAAAPAMMRIVRSTAP